MKTTDYGYAFGFYSPSMQARIIQQEKDNERYHYEALMKKGGVDWDDFKTPFAEDVLINGPSYKPYTLFDVKSIPVTQYTYVKAERLVCPGDDFFYCHRILPAGKRLEIAQGRRRGHAWFTSDVSVPILAKPQIGARQPKTWMSLTPFEMFTQRAAVRMAKGTVVIGGLGLGWLLRAVCAKKTVERVILVEKCKPLMDWIAPRLEAIDPNVAAKTSWLVDDVYNQIGRLNGPDVVHLLDIWDSYGGNDERKLHELRRDMPGIKLWAWGENAHGDR